MAQTHTLVCSQDKLCDLSCKMMTFPRVNAKPHWQTPRIQDGT
jgi:hypothetical protein